ncbi:hypothetical protein GCM10009304_36330 [Pseudomonas matsuisoli]|uniref:Uncharacterized protein n=1 Tax=Pseudomonas matsuisoli TaxID=1515666 RepID=A0A917Q3G4_9PSED|nr:hypothetical protein GCM10009304_36330 [Pseudomonas matsuisoli]
MKKAGRQTLPAFLCLAMVMKKGGLGASGRVGLLRISASAFELQSFDGPVRGEKYAKIGQTDERDYGARRVVGKPGK